MLADPRSLYLTSVLGPVPGLGEHCRRITQSSRDFMENSQFQKLPDDYVRYPGKMDHATIVTFVARGRSLERVHPFPTTYLVWVLMSSQLLETGR